jgi:transcriptional regulator with XRE-family HTH domain
VKREKEQKPPRSLGELIRRRRRELGLRQVEFGLRLKTRSGGSFAQGRVTDLERTRRPGMSLALLEQLPRALRLDPDVVYFWGGHLPPDIRTGKLSEAAIVAAWAAWRAVLKGRGRGTPGAKAALRGPLLHGWKGRQDLGGLLEWRRRQLGLARLGLSKRIRQLTGKAVSEGRIVQIESGKPGVPRLPLMKVLARSLDLDVDVLYFWARRIPPDIDPRGVSESTIKQAWRALRAVLRAARGLKA